MATKKRKAPNKTKKAYAAGAKAVAPLPAPATKEAINQAADLVASLAATSVSAVLEDREGFRHAYRIISAQLHPDNRADRDAWEAFQNAAVLLERHHVARERHLRLTANIRTG